MNTFCVYHTHREGKSIATGYIGITCNFEARKRNHLGNIVRGMHTNTYLMQALKKHTDIIFTKLHVNLSLADALSCEAFYRPVPRMGWNIKAGGLDGKIMSEESKHKISLKHQGKTVSQHTRALLRDINLGKKQSQETKDKRATTLSNLFKGKKKTSQKEIEVLIEGRKGAGNPMAKVANIYDAQTNQPIAINTNLSDWCREHLEFKVKQLQRTANPNEPLKHYKGVYAIYTNKEKT